MPTGGFRTRKEAPATASVVYASTAVICRQLPDWLDALGPIAVICGFAADAASDDAARDLLAADPRVSRVRPEGARD
ncbi:MAG: hypothetical protein OXL68_18780 [Paracoccaceae bacterium]|nr:hypothetical protein [Paracoccaceae bacterium]